MRRFWEVLYDDKRRTMEIIGISTDDTRLIKNISEMQRVGIEVRCHTVDISTPLYDITQSGYRIEGTVYSNVLNEYKLLTRKQLNRW